MTTNCAVGEGFEISPRFRSTIEERIARLEKDANATKRRSNCCWMATTSAGTCAWWPWSAPRLCA